MIESAGSLNQSVQDVSSKKNIMDEKILLDWALVCSLKIEIELNVVASWNYLSAAKD